MRVTPQKLEQANVEGMKSNHAASAESVQPARRLPKPPHLASPAGGRLGVTCSTAATDRCISCSSSGAGLSS